MGNKYPSLYYGDYLQLDTLLNSQNLRSTEYGKTAHDEMLFITIHQVYEIWFKQILWELDSALELFSADKLEDKAMGTLVSRMNRITEIQRILIDQIQVLETMTPLDFLEFRDFLLPASGFQSFQFRLVENKLGLARSRRLDYQKTPYANRLSEKHRQLIEDSENAPSLLELVEKWLERTPFLKFEGFNFWDSYRQAVDKMLDEEADIIRNNPILTDEEKERELREQKVNRESFEALFDEDKHKALVLKNQRNMSYGATQASLLIHLYRDEPILYLPFRLLTLLVDIDELFTTWRMRHALMVHRMIGTKIGTGGSSGYNYLKATAERHKVFMDLFNLATYLIPCSALPKLPDDLVKQLGFFYT